MAENGFPQWTSNADYVGNAVCDCVAYDFCVVVVVDSPRHLELHTDSVEHGNAVLLQQLLRLVLMNIH